MDSGTWERDQRSVRHVSHRSSLTGTSPKSSARLSAAEVSSSFATAHLFGVTRALVFGCPEWSCKCPIGLSVRLRRRSHTLASSPAPRPSSIALRRHHAIPRRLAPSRKPAAPGHPGRALRPRMDSRRLHRHPGDDGRAGPEGGRLLQRRRNAPARPCARGGRQGLQAHVDVQRTACPPARCGSRHDPAGRRLDLIRARERKRGGPMAQRRHAAHARGADAEARPGDDRDQHQPDEHLRAADRRRCREHVPCESGLSGRPTAR